MVTRTTNLKRSIFVALGVFALSNVSGVYSTEAGRVATGCQNNIDEQTLNRLDMAAAEWNLDHGYFKDNDRVVYGSYSKQQLLELADQGDLLAYQVLVRDEIGYRPGRPVKGSEDEHWGRLKNYLESAAVYGSTEALLRLSQLVRARHAAGKLQGRGDIMALALIDVAFRRGDYNAIPAFALYLDSRLSPLTETEERDALKASDAFYKKLVQTRARKSLPGFDNTPTALAGPYVDIFREDVSDPVARRMVERRFASVVCEPM